MQAHRRALGKTLWLICLLCGVAHAAETVSAKLVTVVERPLQGNSVLPGELKPYRSVDVFAKVSGFVESVKVDRGSRVRKGDVLATLAAPEMHAQIAEARARVAASEHQRAAAAAAKAAAEGTFQKLQEAAKTPGAVAGNDLALAKSAYEAESARLASVEKSVQAAETAVAALEEMARYLRIEAEFDGVITERLVHEGSLVGPGSRNTEPLFRLEQVDRLRLVAAVPEKLVGSIRKGPKITFRVPAYPTESFSATIARPAFALDAETRTMPVELDVANTGGRLSPGMYAEITWPRGSGRPARTREGHQEYNGTGFRNSGFERSRGVGRCPARRYGKRLGGSDWRTQGRR
jgi:membrane fusion protein (multidrug efflux system)